MSYTLHIWDEPLPNSLQHADEISSQLGKQRVGKDINPKYVQAAIRLTSKYPFNENPEIELEGEVWSDGPLTPRAGERLWGVGILSQYASEVQPYVVAVSNELGLVVYDYQLGKAYLPNGTVLLPEPKTLQQSSSAAKPWWKVW